MKKLVAVLLLLCLAFAALAGVLSYEAEDAPAVADPYASGDEEGENPAAEAPEDGSQRAKVLDYDAIYALHQPDEVIMTIDGRDVTWDRYFYIFYSQATQTESYFDAMNAYYGMEVGWFDMADEDTGLSYAQLLIDTVEDTLCQLYTIEGLALENGVELTEENKAALEDQLQQDIKDTCGEGAAEADFAEYLSGIYMSLDTYRWINEINYIYQENFIQLYGADGELFTNEAAMAWLEDNGYLSATHILFMTIDSATGEALDETVVAEKKAQAEELLTELRAIEDAEKLTARFKELKEEFCEDTGKVAYPDGYTFTPGTMVAEFEDAVNTMDNYGVSDIVETAYGYHIIMRLPLRVDAVVEFSSDGTPMTARNLAANEEYGSRLQAYYEALEPVRADGFTMPVLRDYLIER